MPLISKYTRADEQIFYFLYKLYYFSEKFYVENDIIDIRMCID